MATYKYEDQLTSSRLITRKLTLEDIPLWAEFLKDHDSTRFLLITDDKTPLEHATDWVTKQLLRYEEHRYGHQALIHKETGEFIGQCGLLLQDINGEMMIEVGYHIFEKYRGQGYAPEAAKLFIDYAFKNDLATEIVSVIVPENRNSQRVDEKNGLTRIKLIQWHGHDVYIYKIER
jgi:RimJ/RimL family protein N-acetyltransferase